MNKNEFTSGELRLFKRLVKNERLNTNIFYYNKSSRISINKEYFELERKIEKRIKELEEGVEK